jgi:hypothetical protein
MLSAAVAALLVQQAQAATTITTVGSSAIDTKTDGDITINSGGGVKITKAGAAVTVNSNNFLNNGGTISNTNTEGAKGILIDASGGAITSPTGVSSSGSIDLTGSGGTKTAIELSGGTFTGPITLTSASVIKVAGDSSNAVVIDAGSTLNGDMTLSGTMTVAPTNLTALTNSSPPTLVNVAGTVNGNVTLDASTVFSGVGQNTRGIVVGPTGSINACNAVAVPGCTEIGTLTNSGNVSLVGAALTTGSNNKNAHPEAGSALIVSGNVAGGIVNGGPTSINDATTAATLSSAGLVTAGGGTVPVVEIGPSGGVATSAITIGIDTADTVDAGASFINRGNIVASPLNANNSTLAVQVVGSSGFVTTLTGNFVNAGTISAIATSATGSSAAAPVATALAFSPFSKTNKIIVSGESAATPSSANGSINASVTGTQGGTAQAVFIDQNAVVPEIDVNTNAKIRAANNVTAPTTAAISDAIAIKDVSNTLALINNAGTISATATTLTPNASVIVQSNFSHAIDLSASTIPVTVNNAGTITGDVLLNSSGNGTVLNVGGGSATGGSPGQQAAAAATATATGVTNSLNNLASVTGAVAFGTGQSTLNVNDFGFVSGQVTSANGTLDVNVAQHGTLDLTNATANLIANTFNINGGTASLSVSEDLRSLGEATVAAKTSATIAHGSSLGVTINSFVPQGQNAYVLISSPTGTLSVPDFGVYQTSLIHNLPFFFDNTTLGASNLVLNPSGAPTDELVLVLTPKTATQLGLVGDAAKIFPFANAALLKDNTLGAAVVNGITDSTKAQQVYSQFTPDVSGNVRAEVIGITDSATGPVSARQRLLRSYADQGGDFTLWGQELAQYINNKGSSGGGITQSKSHGFGFVLGGDGGDPDDGWYGGAFSFFAGDATQALPNDSKNQTEWYQLTGYTDWRGPHMFLDTHLDVGYGSLRGKRFLTIDIPVPGSASTATLSREADGKRAGLLGAFGVTTGAVFNWGDTVLMPTMSIDGMTMREEGYTEVGGGSGFDLKVNPYYADSLRAFLGADIRQDIDLGDFTLQPEGRLGYRYDFLNGAVKIRGAFVSDPNNPFTLVGPDPSRGNVVAGATLGASTDTWSMGLNFDWVRGSHGSTTEVGTVSLLGRI